MRYITVPQLVRAGACAPAIERFIELIGTRIEVTLENAEEYAHRFDFTWAMEHLLKGKAQKNGMRSATALADRCDADIKALKLSTSSPLYWQAVATMVADFRIALARSFAKRYLAPRFNAAGIDVTTPRYWKRLSRKIK